jgi:adenosine deaminase
VTLDFLRRLPKVELHAHLSASIPRSSLVDLMEHKGIEPDVSFLDARTSNEEIFRTLFNKLHFLIRDSQDLRFMCRECFASFENDNVRILELRSAPKKMEDLSAAGYVETVLEEIERWQGTEASRQAGRPKLEVRFLISLNRMQAPENYFELLRRVKSDAGWSKYVTGLDYSGDPWTRDISDYARCFELAREAGMKLSIHTAELPEQAQETPRILQFKPERVGHFIYYTEEEFRFAKEHGITVEACPTSNLVTSPQLSLPAHPISEMFEKGLKLSICTDDQLVFNKSLSEEIFMVTEEFGYGADFVRKVSFDGLESSFIKCAEVRARVRKEMEDFFAANPS